MDEIKTREYLHRKFKHLQGSIPPGCVGCPNFKYMFNIQRIGICICCNKMNGDVEYAKKCRYYFNHPKVEGNTKQRLLLSPKKDDKKPKLKLKLSAESRSSSVGERNSTGSNPDSANPKIMNKQTTLF